MIDISDRFGLAIVGAGLAATPHARALVELKEKIDICGVFKRSQKDLSAFCAEHDFPKADSLDTLLNDPKVDAVLVLAPPGARQDRGPRRAGHDTLAQPVGPVVARPELFAGDGGGVFMTQAIHAPGHRHIHPS